jgi:integrase
MEKWHDPALVEFIQHMNIAKLSPATVDRRVELLTRLATFLADPLTAATAPRLIQFQATFAHLAPASVNIYTRHVIAFYRWAARTGLVEADPSVALTVPRLRRGLPHPADDDTIRLILATSTGGLRKAFVLAAFAGLRAGEITRLEGQHMALAGSAPTALIFGKGGKQRRVPLLAPVVSELRAGGLPRRGWIVTTPAGDPYTPNRLSVAAHHHLKAIGADTTLHSLRHSFATNVISITRDPMLVRDLLGHASVATSEIYMQTSLEGVHQRLDRLAEITVRVTRPQLRAV